MTANKAVLVSLNSGGGTSSPQGKSAGMLPSPLKAAAGLSIRRSCIFPPTVKRFFLIIDQAGWPGAKDLKAPVNIWL
jgi:hypothetical protein